VVDGGSEDQTVAVAKNHGVRIIQAKDSTPGQGRNVGMVNSSHPIVAFIDGDCYVERKDCLRNSVDLLRQEDIDGVDGPCRLTRCLRRRVCKPKSLWQNRFLGVISALGMMFLERGI